jgi:hypothetical protein
LKLVQGIIDDVLRRQRVLEYKAKPDKPPFPVVWVQTYGPATEQLTEIVKEANKVIKSSGLWSNENKVIGLVHRRGKNVGDMVLKKKHFALNCGKKSGTGSIRCTPIQEPGKKRSLPGRPCGACKLMSGKQKIVSNVTGKTYKTASGDCKSSRLIYLADCLACKKQYSGQTVTQLRTRINGHRAHHKAENETGTTSVLQFARLDEATLFLHMKNEHNMKSVEQFNANYTFTILELDPKDLNKCEQKWVNLLNTMEPYGLNIEKPCGVANQLMGH